MILIKNVNLPLETDFSDIRKIVGNALKITKNEVLSAGLYKKSVDARHKNNIVFCCSFTAALKNEEKILKTHKNTEVFVKKEYKYKKCKTQSRPVIAGFGPAGMFAALTLARSGVKPIVIERGSCVEKRTADVEEFFKTGKLNTESNIQFGEGGAGTFSDGKLNSGIHDERCFNVLETFCEFGAPDNIMYSAKPHIGTDILRNVVKNIREEIIKLGGEIYFDTKLDGVIIKNGKLYGIKTVGNKSGTLGCGELILAIGHSARDTFKMLYKSGVYMSAKPFSVGVRIEHRQADINRSLYGKFADSKYLGAADYKAAVHLENGRGVYTFCMCPGGVVVNASSEDGGIAVNGMSYSARDGKNANSALLVEVKPEDLNGDGIFAGIDFQQSIEQKAYNAGMGDVPFCYVGDLYGDFEPDLSVTPTVMPKARRTDINSVMPQFAVQSIKSALPLFSKKIENFNNKNAVLTFPETRSTSPIRINRDDGCNSVNVSGIYPSGEGAGYAGGIMSAAVDGMRIAQAVINKYISEEK